MAWRSLQRHWPDAAIVRDTADTADTAITAALRAVKDASEIAVLRGVAANSVSAFFAGLPRFGAGRRQRDVEAAAVDANELLTASLRATRGFQNLSPYDIVLADYR